MSEQKILQTPAYEKVDLCQSVLRELQKELTEIDFKAVLETAAGDEGFYLELLHDFTQLPIKAELSKYIEEGNHKNYNIRIHGFKSNAYSIGAKMLGNLAYKLERLTEERIPEETRALQNNLFEQYDRICTIYEKVVSEQEGE